MRALCFLATQLCVSVMSLCYAAGHAPAFHVLILYEKGATQHMHEFDAKAMKTTFKSIGDAIGRHVDLSCVKNNKSSMHKIRKWCSGIGSRDIAVLYYSGGFAKNDAYNGLWPLAKIGKESVPVDQVANLVHRRNARLSLVFADCYNEQLKAPSLFKRFYGHPFENVKKKKIREQIKNIWLCEKGSLTMSSTKNGKKAYGIILGQRKFGAFTEALLLAISSQRPEYGIVHKIIEFPVRIANLMMKYPYSWRDKQYPIYQSTIVEG